jgi:hypothetical protein
MATLPFESLDYLYVPAPEIEASVAFYTRTLGGELLWLIRDGATAVAAVRLSGAGPLILLANHLRQGGPLLIYRVQDLSATRASLAAQGWALDSDRFEIPQGPCIVFRGPEGQRLATYERVRPDADRRFMGRFDEK